MYFKSASICIKNTNKIRGGRILQKLFLTYPSGKSGLALLLLRLTLGITLILQGIGYLSDYRTAPIANWFIALLFIFCGTFLSLGFITSIVAAAGFLGIIAIFFSIFPASFSNFFPSTVTSLFTSVMAVVVALIGPGAFSLDALMFGRREIIIPGKINHPKS